MSEQARVGATVEAARDLLDAASLRADAAGIAAAAERFREHAAVDPGSPWPHYHAGYASYRLAVLAGEAKKPAMEHAAAAVEHLKRARRLSPGSAEPRALLSTCYGLQIRHMPLRSPWLGERKWRMMAEAEHLEPENPRVLLLRAMHFWTTPSFVGGDKDAALEWFQRAAESFSVWDEPESLGPRWGHAQALAHLGMAYLRRRDESRARDALSAALRIAPDYHWVKHVLLPKLGIV